MSRQTKKANAFVTGVFGTERIALADTLLDEFAADETLFVVAHELGHYVRRDPWLGDRHRDGRARRTLPAALGRDRGARPAATVGDVGGSTRLAFYGDADPARARRRRRARSRARSNAAPTALRSPRRTTPPAAMRAFRRLRDQNLAEDEGPKWSELLFSSHPSLGSRIAALGG